ncbi:MAG: Double zinc ribbon [Thermomicrobiales bacterium]|nr:Double zinc ribbon [Thermomicrobiales bacterium]
MSEREVDERQRGEETVACRVCGTSNLAGDRFCAECGALLPSRWEAFPAEGGASAAPLSLQTGASAPDASQSPKHPDRENAAWIFGARPAAVIGGGLLLLLLAAALLAIGQRDDTGTIVMLSFCAAPLGLLVLLIGIARYVGGVARRE